jgi:hypothetical protein
MGLYTETNGEEGERFVTVYKARATALQLVSPLALTLRLFRGRRWAPRRS